MWSSLLIAASIDRHGDLEGCQFAFTITCIHNSVPIRRIERSAGAIEPRVDHEHRGES